MKKIYLTLILLGLTFTTIPAQGLHNAGIRSGYILLQVERNGEAWYVYPTDANRYYLGRPDDAFAIMKKLALGARHDFIVNTDIFPSR